MESSSSSSQEYYKKMNQQLVQKDNLIRLLQMQIKKQKEESGGDAAGQVAELEEKLRQSNERIEDLTRDQAAAAAELEARRRAPAAAGAGKAAAGDDDRVAMLEAECENLHDQMSHLKKELARAQKDVHDRDASVELLKGEIRGHEERAERLAATGRTAVPGGIADPLGDLDRVDLGRLELKLDDLHGRGENVEELRAILGKIRSELVLEIDRRDGELERLRGELRKADALREENAGLAERARRLEDQLGSAKLDRALQFDGASDQETIPIVYNVVQLLDELQAVTEKPDTTADAGKTARAALVRISSLLQKLARDLKIERIPTIGEVYDARQHEAVEFVRSREHEDDAVVDEARRGFRQGGRVIRPALVRVVKNRAKCTGCGNVVRSGSIFCDSCGTRLDTVGAPVTDLRGNAEMYYNTARIFDEKNQPEKAREYLQQAVALEPGNPTYILSLARALERSGEFAGALDCLRQIPEHEMLHEEAETRIRGILIKKSIVDGLKALAAL